MGFRLEISFGDKKADNQKAGVQTAETERVINPATYRRDEEEFSTFVKFSSLFENEQAKLLWLFKHVAQVNAVVSYIANVAANLPAKHVVKNKKEEKAIENSPFVALLNTPNDKQNGINFLSNCFSYFIVTGNTYLNPIVPIGFKKITKIFNPPSEKVYPITSQSVEPYGVEQPGIDPRFSELVKYNWDLGGKFAVLLPDEVIHIKDNSLESWTLGQSRLSSAIDNCNTLKGLSDTIDTIMSKGGALGMIKRKSPKGEYFQVMDSEERGRLERQFKRYGTGKGKEPFMFTSEDLEYVRMLTEVKDFMPIEIKDSEFETLCQALGGFPSIIFKASDATFTNLPAAEKMMYTNIIMPIVDAFYEAYTNFLHKMNFINVNESIEADYDDIECLKENKKIEAETHLAVDNVWLNRYNNNLVTLNELLIAVNLPTQKNGDKYKREIDTGAGSQAQIGQVQQN